MSLSLRRYIYHLVQNGILVAEMDKVGGIHVLQIGESRETAMGVA